MIKSKIGTLEAIMIVFSVVVTHTLLSLPRNLLSSTRSAVIINLIYVGIITIFLAYLIYRLLKKFPGLDIIDISETVGGKVFRNIVGIIFIAYFIMTSSLLLRNFCEAIKIIYYPMTNIVFIILLFIISLCIANRLDFSATLKTNLIILPIVFASMVFLFFANINKFVPQRMFPIFGNGIMDTFVLGISNIYAFGGIVFLYFIPPFLKEPEKMKKICLISVGITAIYLILCVSAILFMFSFFMNANEITPLYNATRYIEFGNFFQRLEAVFLLIWIIAFACYLSIISKFTMNIFRKMTNISTKKPLIDIFGLLILGTSLIPKNVAMSQNFEGDMYKYLVLAVVFGIGFTVLILANLKKRRKEKLQNYE